MLKNKKCLITGTTGGIGMAISQLFLQNGAEIFITSQSNNKLEGFYNELKNKYNATIYYKTCNLNNKEEIVELVKEADNKMNGIDVFVGNAGITKDCLSIQMKDELWDEVINTNLTANFILCREIIKIMLKQKYGKIINVSSLIGITGNIGQSNYSASKAGLIAMTKSIALEYASKGITANCVAPGFIDTPMTKKVSNNIKDEILLKIPMKKYGNAIDVANAILFLASNMSDYITGETICVNGGLLMK